METSNSRSSELNSAFLFELRMRKAGLWRQLQNEIRGSRLESGEWDPKSRSRVFRNYGYLGSKGEFDLYWQSEVERAESNRPVVMEEWESRMDVEAEEREYYRVFAQLPNTAPVTEELEWVSSHPALGRKARQDDQSVPIRLKADDLTASPNGGCPSKRAANRLQNWVNNPEGFEKIQYGADKNKTRDQGGTAEGTKVADMGLDQVGAILNTVTVE